MIYTITDHVDLSTQIDLFERHIARLLIAMYYCGQPDNTLISGETRKIDMISRLQYFDFWVREPGHLALALLRSFAPTPERIDERPTTANTTSQETVREAIERMIKDDQADVRRVKLPYTLHNLLEDLDSSLSFLTACELVSDRPSFARSRQFTHQVVLEKKGVEFTQKILAECPTFEWYRQQCELVVAHFTRLEHYDLAVMSYLGPELTPAMASTTALVPYIRQRYTMLFNLNSNNSNHNQQA